ncbi:hypothetical protein [Actinacidiphila oryziradicis]|uniref:Uncharacterized protein n=1 Tax=Actinacidiphila oryziradicis TaxID=2571141 RepID=A0A4U0S877_9ACTN|nr:hypothetical protein [Actinacidiphila oryziradicis]TKA04753.1 hypothetical protein FCI23_34385 [Actinacidiphila oryziradicis]
MPGTIREKNLGSLANWPDARLATSLYECGVGVLGSGRSSAAANGGDLGELLTTFPQSPQAAKVEPAVSSMIDKVAKGLKGGDPCSANTRLHTLSVQASALPGERAGVAGRPEQGRRQSRQSCASRYIRMWRGRVQGRPF